ncbi:MAG: HlyD family type I secretion periplasmic adaptor subunit [Gammaproteobacteria bacterium]
MTTRHAPWTLGLSSAALLAFLIWAHYGRLDVVSNAVGEVVPGSEVKSIQHLEGGIVRRILVRERDTVEPGQPMLELDPTRARAELNEIELRIAALRVDRARLRAEVDHAPAPDFEAQLEADHFDKVEAARALFRDRRARLAQQVAVQERLIAQREAEQVEVQARMRSARKVRAYLAEQIGISEALLKRDITNRMTHLGLLREHTEISGRIDEDVAHLRRNEAALEEARLRLEGIGTEFVEAARTELHVVQRDLDELGERSRTFADTLGRQVVRAPVAGIIKTLSVTTVGGVLQPGETVAEIVPGDDRLMINARLPVQDIGFVRAGQSVQIDLMSADAARFDHLRGAVEGISPDTLLDPDGNPYYKVRVRPEREYFEAPGLRYRLYPGMQVATSILIGERSVLDYLLDPFIQSMGMAMRER